MTPRYLRKRWACFAIGSSLLGDAPVIEAYWRHTIETGWQPAVNPHIVATAVYDGWDDWPVATRIEGTVVPA